MSGRRKDLQFEQLGSRSHWTRGGVSPFTLFRHSDMLHVPWSSCGGRHRSCGHCRVGRKLRRKTPFGSPACNRSGVRTAAGVTASAAPFSTNQTASGSPQQGRSRERDRPRQERAEGRGRRFGKGKGRECLSWRTSVSKVENAARAGKSLAGPRTSRGACRQKGLRGERAVRLGRPRALTYVRDSRFVPVIRGP